MNRNQSTYLSLYNFAIPLSLSFIDGLIYTVTGMNMNIQKKRKRKREIIQQNVM